MLTVKCGEILTAGCHSHLLVVIKCRVHQRNVVSTDDQSCVNRRVNRPIIGVGIFRINNIKLTFATCRT